jgi:ribulose-5-phosphate 4-epimerase/fuculose-1-phosphate aldolase
MVADCRLMQDPKYLMKFRLRAGECIVFDNHRIAHGRAAFRCLHRMDMHESVANHLSAAVSQDGKQFLMNRKWMHFSQVTASRLQLLDSEDDSVTHGSEASDLSASLE